MPNQKDKSSGGRRSAATAASKPKPKLEPLPEIADSSNAVTPTTNSPAPSHSSSRRTQKSGPNTNYLGSSSPSMHHRDDGAMQADALLADASNRTPTASSDRHTSAAVEADSVGSTSSLNQRPRSRTASPWRGKPRTSGSIFSRPKANRQSATGPQLVLQNDAGVPHVLSSAVVGGSEGSMTSSGISSAGLVLERSSTIAGDKPDQHSVHRRRGHTLDPEHYGTRQISSSAGTESGELLEAPSAKLPATASHFHISRSNTALAVRTDRRGLQPGHATRIAKTDSASSNTTVNTIEVDASASSTYSNEPSDAAPRGQLSMMLYNNDSLEHGVGGTDLPSLDTGTLGAFVRSGSGASGLSSAGILGRTKRGGSGGDSRLGEYKGALMRPPTMDIFGTRSRNHAGDQQASGSGAYDDPDLRGGVAYSGPAEGSGVHMPSSADQIMPHARHVQPTRAVLSPGDDISGDTRSAAAFSHASSGNDTIAGGGGQHSRAVPPRYSTSKDDWMYTSPGERPSTGGTADGLGHRAPQRPATLRAGRISTVSPQYEYSEAKDTPLAKSSDSLASTTLHQRRESGQVGRAQAGVLQHHGRSDAVPRVSSDASTHQPLAQGSDAYVSSDSGKRLPSGTDPAMFDDEYSEPWQYNQAVNGSYGGSSDRGDFTSPSQPRNPWTLAPARGHKKMLKINCHETLSSLAVAPYNDPTCVVAGMDSLFLLSMGPDTIMKLNTISNGRRRSTLPQFTDVIWRPMDYIVTGSNLGKVTVWDPNRRGDQTVRVYINEHNRIVQRLTVKPSDPNFVYAAYSDERICGWDFRSDSNTPALRIPAVMKPHDIDCNPIDANMLSAVTEEGRLFVWDVRKIKQPLISLLAHPTPPALCVSWHPTGRFIATGSSDQTIKIWDFKTASYKKTTATALCTIRTISHARRLEWRPGHDTQIASSASNSSRIDPRLQIWDIRNPNHALCSHEKHGDRIMDFAWYDENLVWSAGRERDVIQCDIRSHAMYTEGLLGYTAVDISSSAHLVVATGLQKPEPALHDKPAMPQPIVVPGVMQPANKPPTSSGSSRSKAKRVASGGSHDGGEGSVLGPTSVEDDEYQDLVYLSRFQPKLPVPFVDEHPLGPELEVNANAICNLARSYRYDPNAFKECCEHNSKEARAIGLADISRFWQFLSAVFGDALPLKSKRKPIEVAAEAVSCASPGLAPEHRLVELAASGAQRPYSAATSRSSSGMFASRSVSATYHMDGVSNEIEALTRYPDPNIPSTTLQHTPNGSLAQLQITPLLTGVKSTGEDAADAQFQSRSATLGINGAAFSGNSDRLQRSHLSQSHSNLQHATVPYKFGTASSPKLRSAAHSMSSPPSNFISEPTTPAYRAGSARLPRNYTTGANLSLSGQPLVIDVEQTPDSGDIVESKGQEALLSELSKRFFVHSSATPSTDQQASVVSFPSSTTPLVPQQSLLSVMTSSKLGDLPVASKTPPLSPPGKKAVQPRRITKAELRMAVSSCEYYVDRGDVQTAVTAALLLRNFIHLANWTDTEEWFHAYVMQLDLYMEYTAATEILLASPFASVQAPITLSNTVCVLCSTCGSKPELLPHSGISWCAVCRNMANSCVVCETCVRGEYAWCRICRHGGHLEHIRDWFEGQNQSSCPSGCGHVCQPLIANHALKLEE